MSYPRIQRSRLWKQREREELWPLSKPTSGNGEAPSTAGLRADLGSSGRGGRGVRRSGRGVRWRCGRRGGHAWKPAAQKKG
ncbi:hypothetical protein V6Z11_D13G207100 [Gossypium hirsutum]